MIGRFQDSSLVSLSVFAEHFHRQFFVGVHQMHRFNGYFHKIPYFVSLTLDVAVGNGDRRLGVVKADLAQINQLLEAFFASLQIRWRRKWTARHGSRFHSGKDLWYSPHLQDRNIPSYFESPSF